MTLNTFKCKYLTPVHLKGLTYWLTITRSRFCKTDIWA